MIVFWRADLKSRMTIRTLGLKEREIRFASVHFRKSMLIAMKSAVRIFYEISRIFFLNFNCAERASCRFIQASEKKYIFTEKIIFRENYALEISYLLRTADEIFKSSLPSAGEFTFN